MNKNITVNEVSGGWGCTVDIFSPHTIHLRVKIREFILFVYRYGGHLDHEDVDCECQASDRTAAYVHDLTVNRRGPVDSPDSDVASKLRPESDGKKGLPGLVPFVSCRPGAYGRLLLTVYEWRQTGLLVSSDWLCPVTRGDWRTGFRTAGAVRLTPAD